MKKRILFSCNFCGTVCSEAGQEKHLKKYHKKDVILPSHYFTKKWFDAV